MMNKKLVFAMVLMFSLTFTFAQDDKKEEEQKEEEQKEGWTRGGNVAINFNQTAFNNEWTGGGISNLAANVLINYDFNLKKGDLIWDNKLIADYGAYKNKGQDVFTKSNDRLEFNSLVGKKAKGFWYYSGYFNMKTQMDTGYFYDDDGVRGGIISHFFSPAYFQVGPGMLWKKSDNLHVNFSPAAAKMIIVHDEFTEVPDAGVDAFNEAGGYFGVEANETSRFEVGASVKGYYKVDLMENISMENSLALYANYLEDPQNVDVDYTLNLVMAVNKFISTNLTFQAIYDDNAQRNGFQVREAFGVGVNFKF